jgi:transmembrane 9 superfamily protein 2/4
MVQVPQNGIRKLRRLVARKYRVHANLDSLPVTIVKEMPASAQDQPLELVRGYPLGFVASSQHMRNEGQEEEEEEDVSTERSAREGVFDEPPEIYYFNHIKFLISYTEDPQEYEGIRIVGFTAEPVSIAHKLEDPKTDPKSVGPKTALKTCSSKVSPVNGFATVLPLRVNGEAEVRGAKLPSFDVIYSYEVEWVRSNLSWTDRWDQYMGNTNPDDRVHYLSIMNSLLVCLSLSCVVAFFLVRTLRKDISYYNERLLDVGAGGEDEDEGGWKLLHGDVFRIPPAFVSALCIAVGTGTQLSLVIFLTIFTAVSGILPPMGKGQLVTASLVLYIMSGSVAGYVSARLFKYFDLTGWKINTIMTATAFPGLIMALFLALDICLAWAGASSAVSIWVILLLFLLWVGVASPLVVVGSYFGYRAAKIENPAKTKQIARHIPSEQPWYTKAPYSMIAGGVLPFFSVLLEVYFIMEAVWLHQLYYVMAFLFGVFLILVTICAEISISLCYLQLNAEDHQWHWKAFLNSASFGGYLFAYSIWFAASKLALVGFIPTIVYFAYMSMASLSLALLCGSVGFLSSLWFVRVIYGAVKVD